VNDIDVIIWQRHGKILKGNKIKLALPAAAIAVVWRNFLLLKFWFMIIIFNEFIVS